MFSPATRQAFVLNIIVWMVFVYGSYVVSELIRARTGFVLDLPIDLPAVFIVALLAFALYPFAERTANRSPLVRWTIVLTMAFPIAFAQSLVNMVENRILGVIPALDAAHLPLILERFSRNFLSHLYLCIATGALFIFLVETRRTQAQRIERMRAEALAREARMAALSLQMNPHFLFNALNGVSSLILSGEPDAADAMVGRLAAFLRQTLSADIAGLVPLAREIETLRAYLDIETVRFEDRMIVIIDCPAALDDWLVPPLLLQPLAENAVKHGVARSRRPVTIRIIARAEADMLVLRVEDDANMPTGEPGLGIGTTNVAERLATRYGAKASIEIGPTSRGFAAELRLPRAASQGDCSLSS